MLLSALTYRTDFIGCVDGAYCFLQLDYNDFDWLFRR